MLLVLVLVLVWAGGCPRCVLRMVFNRICFSLAHLGILVMKKEVGYAHRSLATDSTAGPHGEPLGSVRRQREKNVSTGFYCGFYGKAWVRQGTQA